MGANEAKESSRVKKARKKLEQQLAEERSKVTPEALKNVLKSIQSWIARHSDERLSLKSKTIELFDENKHSAHSASKYVSRLYNELKDTLSSETDIDVLRGRIKPN